MMMSMSLLMEAISMAISTEHPWKKYLDCDILMFQ